MLRFQIKLEQLPAPLVYHPYLEKDSEASERRRAGLADGAGDTSGEELRNCSDLRLLMLQRPLLLRHHDDASMARIERHLPYPSLRLHILPLSSLLFSLSLSLSVRAVDGEETAETKRRRNEKRTACGVRLLCRVSVSLRPLDLAMTMIDGNWRL